LDGREREIVLVVAPAAQRAYELKYRETDGVITTVCVHLTKIGNALFADLYRLESEEDADAPSGMSVHLFAKLELGDTTLKLSLPDPEWFDKRLADRPSAMAHLKQYAGSSKGWIYLTDSTKHVRSFLKSCLKKPGVLVEVPALFKVLNTQELPPQASPPADNAPDKAKTAPGK